MNMAARTSPSSSASQISQALELAPPPTAGRAVDPCGTLARLQSARAALCVSTASVEAAAGSSLAKLDAGRDLLECLSLRQEVAPAEAWVERQRRDDVALMAGRARATLHREAVRGMEVALARSREEVDAAEEMWSASLAR
jgi:hypothetical protein